MLLPCTAEVFSRAQFINHNHRRRLAGSKYEVDLSPTDLTHLMTKTTTKKEITGVLVYLR